MTHVADVLKALKEVFKNVRYFLLSLSLFTLVIVFSIWLPNLNFIKHTATSTTLSVNQKLGILSATLGAIKTNFTPISRITTILVASLFSVNTSLTLYYIKKRVSVEKTLGTNFVGMLVGLLGVGCASCGSVLLTSFIGLSATASFLTILPLKGAEFGLISVVILAFSLYVLSRKLNDPLICKPEVLKKGNK